MDINSSATYKIDRETYIKFLYNWPIFLISVIIFLVGILIFIRYTDSVYSIQSRIQILDESQDSEMALPTAMTIFNRSMVNLENEISVLNSFNLQKNVVSKLKSNIEFYSVGNVKSTLNSENEWFDDYTISYKIDTDTITREFANEFQIETIGLNEMNISVYDFQGNELETIKFNSFTTISKNHNLPFELTLGLKDSNKDKLKMIKFNSFELTVQKFIDIIDETPYGVESDQIDLKMEYPNTILGEEYLNTLAENFNKDGVNDRQKEYKSTIEFVDNRSDFLRIELEKIETQKQNFKKSNNFTDISFDADAVISQQFIYNSELFNAESQLELIKILKDEIKNSDYKYMPIDLGIENSNVNQLINEYNILVAEYEKLKVNAGPNSTIFKVTQEQVNEFSRNILSSIENYENILESKISTISQKEIEYLEKYSDLPSKERILRSIDRELQVKESLFILLLQKREEAAINLAVIKPAIKIIDFARSSIKPVYPNNILLIFLSISTGFIIPFLMIYFWILFDSKIYSKNELKNKLNLDIPISGEVPFVENETLKSDSILSNLSRDYYTESIRLVSSNLEFMFTEKNNNAHTILVTSSIKGEGKTMCSVKLASVLSGNNKRVLLIGSDLRNPQIHKFFGIEKSVPGLSSFLYNKEKDWRKLVRNSDGLYYILSGPIPPNPLSGLSSTNFSDLMDQVKKEYDYVIIDTAPTMIVSDTIEISKYVDCCLYIFRSGFTSIDVLPHIEDLFKEKKLPKMSIILNSVGKFNLYGYDYNYNYKYGYGYNYGYGYGYNEDS